MTAPKLTPARRAALAVLLEGETTGREVMVSNHTTPAGWLVEVPFTDGTDRKGNLTRLTVYHQVADWLEANGYVTRDRKLGADRLQLTATGRTLAQEHADV